MLKYCQNCYTKPRKHAVTNMNLMDVCWDCARDIQNQIRQQKLGAENNIR